MEGERKRKIRRRTRTLAGKFSEIADGEEKWGLRFCELHREGVRYRAQTT
jgi:hypothetical protein